MNDQSRTFRQMTLEDLSSATSSAEFSAGHSLSTLPDGREIGPPGLAVVPVSRSRRRGKVKPKATTGTSGPSGSTASSASVVLTRYLVNRLMLQFDTVGSMEYVQTWKERVTPSGRSYSEHTARGRLISDSDCTGWPSPIASDDTKLKQCTNIVGWPTATVNDATGSGYCYSQGDHSKPCLKLPGAVELAGWPTPMAGSPGTEEYNPAGNNDSSRKTVELVGWNTPRATDGSNGGPNQTGGALPADAAIAGWARPASRDHKDTPGMATTGVNPDGSERSRLDQLPRQAGLIGSIPTGINAETGKPVAYPTTKMRLNPFFSLYLMGFPVSWGLVGLASSIESKKG